MSSETLVKETLEVYQTIAHHSVILAISVIVTESTTEAEKIAGDIRHFRVAGEGLQPFNIGSHEQALKYVRQAGATRYTIEERSPRVNPGKEALDMPSFSACIKSKASLNLSSTAQFLKIGIG